MPCPPRQLSTSSRVPPLSPPSGDGHIYPHLFRVAISRDELQCLHLPKVCGVAEHVHVPAGKGGEEYVDNGE